MRNPIALFGAAASLLLVLPAACNHERSGLTTTTGAEILPAEDAVNRLTARRCEREFDCNNIGAGKKYEDHGACEREVAHDLRAELRPANCTYGVRGDKLEQCMQELRNEKCGNPLDAVSRLATCRTGRICLR
jgi:hypothetical protein